MASERVVLAVLFFAVAVLYSAVGQAGASGYLAAMALVAVEPAVMRPTALALNILVAAAATLLFLRAGHFLWSLFWPLALASVPLAFVGGTLAVPETLYRRLVGALLFLAAACLARPGEPGAQPARHDGRAPPLSAALACGAAIGFLSGVTGMGGGILLAPVLLLFGWAETRKTAGISAAFILVNSIAGLAGHLATIGTLPMEAALWAPSVLVGGLVGAELGRRRLPAGTLRLLLAIVLVVAGSKLLLG